MANKLYQKAYKYNLVWWKRMYDPYSKYETHHLFGRVGIMLCCPKLWTLAKHGHQDDWKWVGELREAFLPFQWQVKNNVHYKGQGCVNKIFPICDNCYFFIDK